MRLSQIFSPRRCQVCKRHKEQAKHEQVTKREACGIEQCPFHSYITGAIRAELKVELLSFDLSSEDVLEGDSIQVSWLTKNCKGVSITGYGVVPESGTITLAVTRRTRQVEINLVDLFGEVFHHTRRVRVRRKPTLAILECHSRVLLGERSFIRFKARNAKQVLLRDENGPAHDLTNQEFFTTEALSKDASFTLCVVGKYGGEAREEIKIRVFEPPFIHFFESHASETVDTLPVRFSFNYHNESKAEIFRNGVFMADVTGEKEFTFVADNKTDAIATPRFELIVTGQTGATTVRELRNGLSIYPQPSITQVRCRPDNVILFPQPATFTTGAAFCEKILVSDGHTTHVIEPGTSFKVSPSSDTWYIFTPVGKLGFHGQPQSATVQVVYPVEIEAVANKSITLFNVPVTVSWRAKNHTQILIEPEGVDVTNLNSYDIRLERKTLVRVWAINQLDRKAAEVFVDVLSYPKFDGRLFGGLPKLELRLPEIKLASQPALTSRDPARLVPAIRMPRLPGAPRSLPSLSSKLLASFKRMMPRSELSLFRALRSRLLGELRAIMRKK
jgi:hypothetical protein